MKLFDRRYVAASIAMGVATAAAIAMAPPTKMFVDGIESKDLWSGLHQRLLPNDKWFGVLDPQRISVAREHNGTVLTTGSIPQPAPAAQQPAAPERSTSQ